MHYHKNNSTGNVHHIKFEYYNRILKLSRYYYSVCSILKDMELINGMQ